MAGRRHGPRGPARAQRWALALVLASTATPALAREPRSTAVGGLPVSDGVSAACRGTIVQELAAGELAAVDGCEEERRAAQRRQIAAAGRPRPAFGVVERARAGLTKVLLVVSEARGCARWPLRLPGHPVLGLYEVKSADCWVRRYSGEVSLGAVLPDGRRVDRVYVARADGDGRLELDLMEIDASLRRRGQPGLDAYVRLELGSGGWAGRVDLATMRGLLADQHAAWVLRGRGVPALMAVRHPKHASADRVRGLALEASLRRQEADYKAVLRGELSPRRFRERYPWSPYRQLIQEDLE